MDFLRTSCCATDSKDRQANETNVDDEPESRQLAKKAGFVSLKDRLENLAAGQARGHNELDRLKRVPVDGQQRRQPGSKQFATLQELFSSQQKPFKSYGSNCQQQRQDKQEYEPKKSKIPIMKLSKEDWNVKCWEDRLSSHKRRQDQSLAHVALDKFAGSAGSSRQRAKQKPLEQVKVFRGRIEEVATKLERVCEGAPADEKLYELTKMNNSLRGEFCGPAGTHEWTDLLKSELMKGTHNAKQLKAELAALGAPERSLKSKWPPGRPVRRLFEEEEEEDDDDYFGGDKKEDEEQS